MENYYEAEELRNNIFRIGSAEQVFMDLFVGSEKALLFDTGFGYGDLRKTVREITDLPLIVVNSHGHLDHSCGDFQFDEDIYIHPEDMDLYYEHNSREARVRAVENGKHSINPVTGQMENILPEGFDDASYIDASYSRLIPVREGSVFDLGGLHLEVYYVPGHTRGSLGLLCKEEKLFYAGDAMNPFLWLFAPESTSLSEYIQTLRKTEMIEFGELVISHRPGTLPKKVLKDYLEVAENVDYEKGVPFSSPLIPGAEGRICIREGYDLHDMDKPGFASIVVGREHLR